MPMMHLILHMSKTQLLTLPPDLFLTQPSSSPQGVALFSQFPRPKTLGPLWSLFLLDPMSKTSANPLSSTFNSYPDPIPVATTLDQATITSFLDSFRSLPAKLSSFILAPLWSILNMVMANWMASLHCSNPPVTSCLIQMKNQCPDHN